MKRFFFRESIDEAVHELHQGIRHGQIEIKNGKFPAKALEVAAMTGYQRLALQIVGSLKVPISKKKEPMTWEEIYALVLEIRVELGLSSQ